MDQPKQSEGSPEGQSKPEESIQSFDIPEGERSKWITVFGTEFYPDFLAEREARHKPTLVEFKQLAEEADSSASLLRNIMRESNPLRTQLCRLFNKYVSPDTSVEMLKVIRRTEDTIRDFGDDFRPIEDVQSRLLDRSEDDEALFAILGEYDTRGQKGYDLTDSFFNWFEAKFEDKNFEIEGPRGAGADLILSDHIEEYPFQTPADFLIRHEGVAVCAGFARYDGDRGGAQEDDRTKGNERHATQVLSHVPPGRTSPLNVLFINDGPGLLLGSMWSDYIRLEQIDDSHVMVSTLLMIDERLTEDWLLS